MKKRPISLRKSVVGGILLCWLLPVIMVVALAGVLLERNYRQSAEQELRIGAGNALRQVQNMLEDTVTDSKAVSYDGVVRNAYRDYQGGGTRAALYQSVNDYLSREFSRNDRYKAVFITFWDPQVGADTYVISRGTTGSSLSRKYRLTQGEILESMADADTAIRFYIADQELYMTRNLLDSSFTPYATISMMLDAQTLFRPLYSISRITDICIQLDGWQFRMGEDGTLEVLEEVPDSQERVCFQGELEDHAWSFSARGVGYSLWKDSPELGWAVLAVALLGVPMLGAVAVLFYRHVTRPMETLAQANRRVQEGERGYQIAAAAPNVEFERLFDNFNSMSAELKNQFERSYLEQQATQRAKIKALQSQINPHFLNNTLEIINWEARLADNQRVSAMIEALSTMLNAVLDRDDRAQIPLSEELGYVDAYLYIIRERLGEGFRVYQQIHPEVMGQMIPRLILQPLVENAVEHDITARRGGVLRVRAYHREGDVVLEVEHDGTMTPEDREKIRILLSNQPGEGAQLGLRNVSQRLRLIYGDRGSLMVTEPSPGTVLARIRFPAG